MEAQVLGLYLRRSLIGLKVPEIKTALSFRRVDDAVAGRHQWNPEDEDSQPGCPHPEGWMLGGFTRLPSNARDWKWTSK
jgi:hypothetical protein